jgi:hypothetical protein
VRSSQLDQRRELRRAGQPFRRLEGCQGTSVLGRSSVYPGELNGDGLTDLFLYNPANGASYTEFANGSGGWAGVPGSAFSAGWSVYPGQLG